MLSYRQRNIPLRRYRFTSAAKAAEGSNSLSCIAESPKRPLGWRQQAIAAASLVLLLIGLVIGLVAPATAAPEDSTAARSILTHELDAMLKTWFAPLPRSAAVEIFSKEDRPKRSREEWETLVREGTEWEQANGRTFTDDELKDWIQMHVTINLKAHETQIRHRERYLRLDDAVRLDSVGSFILEPISPATPYQWTVIEPGDLQKGDTREFKYQHPNLRPAAQVPATSVWRPGPGNAYSSDFRHSAWIRPVLEELIGIERLLLEKLAGEVCDLPPPALQQAPDIRELPLNRQKIENLLADKGSIKLRVSEFEVAGQQRLRIRFLVPNDPETLAAKEQTPSAEIVVKAADFRFVYEQRIFAETGIETVVVTADGFDDQGIPKEKTWVRRRPDGQHETISYAILNAKVNIDIPAAEFEFNPPEGYLVDVMGPDGRPIKSDAPPPPAIERKPFTNRLWGLNLLAVLVLAAFTIRKFLLRRQTAVGG